MLVFILIMLTSLIIAVVSILLNPNKIVSQVQSAWIGCVYLGSGVGLIIVTHMFLRHMKKMSYMYVIDHGAKIKRYMLLISLASILRAA